MADVTAAETAKAEAAAAAALAACKSYMRVDGDEDDELILRTLMPAAKTYLSNAGIPEPKETDSLYTLAVYALTLHYYDHRDAVGDEEAIPTNLRPVINQLKHCGEGCI